MSKGCVSVENDSIEGKIHDIWYTIGYLCRRRRWFVVWYAQGIHMTNLVYSECTCWAEYGGEGLKVIASICVENDSVEVCVVWIAYDWYVRSGLWGHVWVIGWWDEDDYCSVTSTWAIHIGNMLITLLIERSYINWVCWRNPHMVRWYVDHMHVFGTEFECLLRVYQLTRGSCIYKETMLNWVQKELLQSDQYWWSYSHLKGRHLPFHMLFLSVSGPSVNYCVMSLIVCWHIVSVSDRTWWALLRGARMDINMLDLSWEWWFESLWCDVGWLCVWPVRTTLPRCPQPLVILSWILEYN